MARFRKPTWVSIKLTTKAFERDVRKAMERVGDRAADFVRKQMFEVATELTELTPVDTGRAAAAWLPIFKKIGMAEPAGRGSGEGTALGKREGEARANLEGDKPFARITNRVNYILPLEYGHSSQRPNGFFRITLNRHAARLRQFVRRHDMTKGVRL